jgi:hypothetical protein
MPDCEGEILFVGQEKLRAPLVKLNIIDNTATFEACQE